MWLDIFNITKSIISSVIEKESKQKEKIANLFLQISETILEAADKLSEDKYPHYSCSVMKKLCESLKDNLSGLIDQNILEEYHAKLIQVSYLEHEFAIRKEPDTIPKLQEAAGEFKAFSMLLKI